MAYRAKKFARRNRIPVALAAAVFAATAAGIVATMAQARTTRMERDFALRQLSRAEAIEALNTFVLSDAAPSKKTFPVNDQLAGAEELVAKQKRAAYCDSGRAPPPHRRAIPGVDSISKSTRSFGSSLCTGSSAAGAIDARAYLLCVGPGALQRGRPAGGGEARR